MHKPKKEKVNCLLRKYCQRKTHLENFCWWRHDAICGNCKHASHVIKVCNLKNNLKEQVVEAEIDEEQLLKLQYRKQRRSVEVCFS